LESLSGLHGHVCNRPPHYGVLLIPLSPSFLAGNYLPFSSEIINIAMVVNTTNSSGVGRMWLSVIPEGSHTGSITYMLQFSSPAQFSVGSNKIGVLEITERREIAPKFIDMMGFTPVCDVLHARPPFG
jgi:hypothetical protein